MEPQLDALKKQLAAEITRALGGPRSQFTPAPMLGIPQPRMSEISRGRVDRYTVDWFIRTILRLGGTVSLTASVPTYRPRYNRRRRE
jgi:predicted XRE-type DNA-binding protein